MGRQRQRGALADRRWAAVSDVPDLDGRDRDQIRDHLDDIAPYYVDEWVPDSDDPGTVLFEIFADMSESVIERLDRVPEKQRAAFFDALDFETQPPRPARVPVSFDIDETTDPVPIPSGTAVRAESTDDRPEQRFETDESIAATPADLVDLLAVEPGLDRIVDHGDLLEGESTRLFDGPNRQRHAVYLGRDEVLDVSPGSVIELELTTNAPAEVFESYVEWEYFGEFEGETGWHSLEVETTASDRDLDLSAIDVVESFLEWQSPPGYTVRADHPQYDLLVRSVARFIEARQSRHATDREAGGRGVPPTLFYSEVDERIERRMQRRLRALESSEAFTTEFSADLETRSISLTIPGEIAQTEVDGIESRWIRCRIPEQDLVYPLFSIFVDSIDISVGSDRRADADGLDPEDAIANDVPLDLSEAIRPFGKNPTAGATFSLACEEAFTTLGAAVDVRFDRVDEEIPDDIDPVVTWEYWNGNTWRRLQVQDGTDAFQSAGTVSFDVPTDIEVTSVLGHDRHWVRCRLVEGGYGDFRIEQTDDETFERVDDHLSPPIIEDITVDYELEDVPFRHQLTQNNLAVRDVTSRQREFRPFESPIGDEQALYLGFDEALSGGPITLYVPIDEELYPEEFTPQISVEFCRGAPEDWQRVHLQDGTSDLTERGMLQFSLPEPTESVDLFGTDRHWIRIRMVGDEFLPSGDGLFRSVTTHGSNGRSALAKTSIAERERREQAQNPPALDGLYLNAAWARNASSIDDEVLGSSTERANQTFEFAHSPVVDADVWVEESDQLSRRERHRLGQSSRPIRIERDAGSVTEVWVQWTPVSDFFGSDDDSRQYVLDRTSGTVTFGDGHRGAIPPAGENNVKADYSTGGGQAGNVEAGSIGRIEEDIPFVGGVTNPDPGINGEDRESMSTFVSRAPKRLRDRGRPVTADGFERIARSSATGIAMVRCRAGEAETGRAGHVTLLVVPDTSERKPLPSQELLKQIERRIEREAPEAVTGESSLTVRGPRYLEVSVEATVEATDVQSVSAVREACETALTEYAHPVDGGPDGTGWTVGSVPAPGQFTTCLERQDGVNRVTRLFVTYSEDDRSVTLSGGQQAPEVPEDALIYSGRHEVSVDLELSQR